MPSKWLIDLPFSTLMTCDRQRTARSVSLQLAHKHAAVDFGSLSLFQVELFAGVSLNSRSGPTPVKETAHPLKQAECPGIVPHDLKAIVNPSHHF